MQLKGLVQGGHPKPLIETIAEDLLTTFKSAPLLDAYDVYQHLMDYWAETMQDDCYLIADAGWKAGALPREIRQVKNKDGKLAWPEKEDFRRGKRRFKSDLIPAAILIARYFAAERDAITALEAEGFYPEITDGCKRVENFKSCLAVLRRILGLWRRSMYSNTSALAVSSVG